MEKQKAQSLSSYADESNNLPPLGFFLSNSIIWSCQLKGTAVLDVMSGLELLLLVCEYNLYKGLKCIISAFVGHMMFFAQTLCLDI